MNILYFVQRWPSLSESFILNELHELQARGHSVAVFAVREQDISVEHYEHELEIPVGYASAYKPGVKGLVSSVPEVVFQAGIVSRHYRRAPLVATAAFRWAKDCQQFVDSLNWEPDLIHSHFAEQVMIAAHYVSVLENIPWTVTTHAYDLFSPPNTSIRNQILANADCIITVSDFHREWIKENIKVNTPIEVIWANIDVNKFAPVSERSDPTQLLTVGRLVEKKGHDIALKAVNQLVQQGYDIKFDCIGWGPLEDDLVQLAEKLDVQNCISFRGKVTDEDLLLSYDRAGVFLQPCRTLESGNRDGIPTTLKEAMAMETVPITTPVAGIPELVTDSKDGFIVPENSPEQVAEKAGELIEKWDMWHSMSKEARITAVNKSSIQETVDDLANLFESLIP